MALPVVQGDYGSGVLHRRLSYHLPALQQAAGNRAVAAYLQRRASNPAIAAPVQRFCCTEGRGGGERSSELDDSAAAPAHDGSATGPAWGAASAEFPARRFLSAMIGVASVTVPAWADPTPPSNGPPGQTCQLIANRAATPGNASSSPGSPFNLSSGTGGQHYSTNSQYDVACFQQFQHSR